MSEEAYRAHRDGKAREKWEQARTERLRSALQALRGKTCWFEVATPTDQLVPRVLGQIVGVRGDEVEVIDMSDAMLPPNAKPRRTIGFGQILNWGTT